ncbi:MAG TPA: MerR family transcriptional regulator [bacterium]
MSLANCSRCGKVYLQVSGGREICPACIKEEENNYLKIFHYMSALPSATAQEIAQATEVDIKEIYRYVRENRLRLVKSDTGLFCESCGVPISQGKVCEKCRNKLSEEIRNDINKNKHARSTPPSKSQKTNGPKYLKDRRNKGKGP